MAQTSLALYPAFTIFVLNNLSIAMKQEISKIEKIREATLKVVSTKGQNGASVAAIAAEAGVSVGYLYRYYKSKNELIDDLYETMVGSVADALEEAMRGDLSMEQLSDEYFRSLYRICTDQPDRMRFMILLQNDPSYDSGGEGQKRLRKLCNMLYIRCRESNDFRPTLTVDDLYMAMAVIPVQYMAQILRRFFVSDTSAAYVVNKIQELALGAIR